MFFNTQSTKYFDANGNFNWVSKLFFLVWFVLGIKMRYEFKITCEINNKCMRET